MNKKTDKKDKNKKDKNGNGHSHSHNHSHSHVNGKSMRIEDQFYTDLYGKLLLFLSREKKHHNGSCYLADYSDDKFDELFYLLQYHIDKKKIK